MDPPSDCFFAQPGNPAFQVNSQIAFQGAVNFGPGADEAWVCIERRTPRTAWGPTARHRRDRHRRHQRRRTRAAAGQRGRVHLPQPGGGRREQVRLPAQRPQRLLLPGDHRRRPSTGFLTPKDPGDPQTGFSSFTGTADRQRQAARRGPPRRNRAAPGSPAPTRYDLDGDRGREPVRPRRWRVASRAPPVPAAAVVLLSGGLDSSTVLAVARRKGFEVHCLSVDYGQRHKGELAAARRVARALGAASHRSARVNLSLFGGSALTDAAIAVPKGRSEAPDGRGHPGHLRAGPQHGPALGGAGLGRGAGRRPTSSSA